MRTADGRGPQTKSARSDAVRLGGALNWGQPHLKRVPIDVLTVEPDRLEVRSRFGKTTRVWERSEIRRIAWVPRRWVLLRPGIKVTFRPNPTAGMPLYFRPWRSRHLRKVLGEAGWQVHTGEPE
jgi:hypothetical protein